MAAAADPLETAFALKDRRPPDPGTPWQPPAWASEPAPQISAERRTTRTAAVRTAVSQLPQDIPKSLEPFVTVNTRSTDEVE